MFSQASVISVIKKSKCDFYGLLIILWVFWFCFFACQRDCNWCRYTVFWGKFGKTCSGLLIERSMNSFEYTSIQTENSRVLSQWCSKYNCPESKMFYIYLFKSSCDSTFVSCIFSQNHSRKGTSDSQSNNHSRLSPSNSSALG